MLSVKILAVGTLKDSWLKDGCDEYCKRLQGMCRMEIIEIEEARLPAKASRAQIDAALDREGTRILEKAQGSVLIALCIEGQELSSGALSSRIGQLMVAGNSALSFAIGSSYGLSERVKQSAPWHLSLSRMTFPHQLARLLLCEQLYRALSISSGGKYHK